jgi:hypothetical protein
MLSYFYLPSRYIPQFPTPDFSPCSGGSPMPDFFPEWGRMETFASRLPGGQGHVASLPRLYT